MRTRTTRIHSDLYDQIKDLATKERVSRTTASKYIAKEYENAKFLEQKHDLDLRKGKNRHPILKLY